LISIGGGGNPFGKVNPMKMMGAAAPVAKMAAGAMGGGMNPLSSLGQLGGGGPQAAGGMNPASFLKQSPLSGIGGAGGTSILSILNSQQGQG
jgi:hypothetical protein